MPQIALEFCLYLVGVIVIAIIAAAIASNKQ